MRVLALLLLVIFPLSAQSLFSSLIGMATEISGDQITVQSGSAAPVLLFVDKESKIWRGKTTNVLSAVQPGDEVNVRYRQDSTGRRVILNLYANFDHVWGRITKLAPTEFEVEQNFNADPQSAYRRRYRSIAFDSDTQFESSRPEDLRVGRTVDINGLKINDSRFEASRIIIYEGNAPVRMVTGVPVVRRNGAVQNRK
jgi:Domain of unknown function (DUF5666)